MSPGRTIATLEIRILSSMPNEHSDDLKFEIGHVLFIDIVGYSKLLDQRTERTA